MQGADAAVVGAGVGLAGAAIATAAAIAFWDRLELVLLVMVMIGAPLAHVVGGPLSRAMKARRTRIAERRMACLRRDFLAERTPLAPLPPSREKA